MDRSKKPYYNGNISENRIFCILQDYIYIYICIHTVHMEYWGSWDMIGIYTKYLYIPFGHQTWQRNENCQKNTILFHDNYIPLNQRYGYIMLYLITSPFFRVTPVNPRFLCAKKWPEVIASAAEDLTSCGGGSEGSYGCPYGGFLKGWHPIAGWFIRGNPFQIDDLN